MTGPPAAVARTRSAVRRALSGLAAGDLVAVACSGGADSSALSGATAFVAPRMGLRAAGITVDHGLQSASSERATNVGDMLRGLDLHPVRVVSVTVGTGGGPEAAARTARYTALEDSARSMGANAILLGHTRDDQAETVLLRLARGSGARSLAAMPASSGRYMRPLLGLDRATVHEACALMGMAAWHDPHNVDPAYARSRVRKDALPCLESALGPGVAGGLARTASLLRDDADALDAWAARAAQDAACGDGDLDVAALAELPRAVRTRVLRRAAIGAGCPGGSLAAAHVAELDRLVTEWRGQAHVDLPGGLRGRRVTGRITIAG